MLTLGSFALTFKMAGFAIFSATSGLVLDKMGKKELSLALYFFTWIFLAVTAMQFTHDIAQKILMILNSWDFNL